MPLSERVSDCSPHNGFRSPFPSPKPLATKRLGAPTEHRASFYDRIQTLRGAPYLDSPCEPSLAMLRFPERRHMLAAGIGGIGIVGVVIIVIIILREALTETIQRNATRGSIERALIRCYYGAATPSTLSVVRGSPTGYEADAELIYVTGREEMQVVDHPVVTAHE